MAWTFDAGAPIVSAPLVVAGIVYIVDGGGVVHALALESGETCWTSRLGTTASASPSIVDGLLVVGDDRGTIHALALADGSSRWTQRTDGEISGAVGISGHMVIAATNADTAYALDASSGAVQWSTSVGGPVGRSVAIGKGLAFVGAGSNLVAIAVADGKVRWSTPIAPTGGIGSPAVAEGLVFAATGLDDGDLSMHGVVAVDAATGAKVWRFRSTTGAAVYSPAVVKGRAYVVGEDRRVTALDAATGKVIWMITTKEVDEVLAAVVGDQVFVAGNGGAMNALDLATGAIQWSVPFTGIPYGTTVVDGLVLVGTDAGALVAIRGS